LRYFLSSHTLSLAPSSHISLPLCHSVSTLHFSTALAWCLFHSVSGSHIVRCLVARNGGFSVSKVLADFSGCRLSGGDMCCVSLCPAAVSVAISACASCSSSSCCCETVFRCVQTHRLPYDFGTLFHLRVECLELACLFARKGLATHLLLEGIDNTPFGHVVSFCVLFQDSTKEWTGKKKKAKRDLR